MQSTTTETHLVRRLSHEEQIEGYGSHQVDQKPSLQVVHGYFARMRDDLVVAAYVRRPEVDQDVHYEGHVHWKREEQPQWRNLLGAQVFGKKYKLLRTWR